MLWTLLQPLVVESLSSVPPVGCPTFTCDVGAHTPAESVHRLRPSDVRVVAAFGDSLTAAFGAEASSLADQFASLREYRKDSWSGGGGGTYESTCTLPNILRKFSSTVSGAATGTTWVPLSKDSSAAGLDVAVSGSLASDFEDQARRAVSDLSKLRHVNVTHDWKVATVFTGGNDLCAVCDAHGGADAQAAYMASLEAGLDVLLASMPRLLVNLVSEVDVSLMQLLNQTRSSCEVHDVECPCLARSAAEMHSTALLYQQAMHKVAALPRYHARDDWTVVVQPFYENFAFPRTAAGEPDTSFFAPDCFHYSTKGQASAAVALWNNMLQPVGEKQTWSCDYTSRVMCPTNAQPFLATAENSRSRGPRLVEGERAP
jgi:phospholipase B1